MKRNLFWPRACLAAVACFAASSAATAACNENRDPANVMETWVGQGPGAQAIRLRLLPGGIAEYVAGGTCTALAFTALRDGAAVYTDDGLGRGLTVVVGTDRSLTVLHASGWTSRGQ